MHRKKDSGSGHLVLVASFSEARKFAAHFCLANQFTQQIPEKVRAAVLGNAGSLIVFRVASADATLLAPEFDKMPPSELTEQHPFTAWIRRGNLGHAKITALPRLFAPRGRRARSSNKAAEIRPAETHRREGRGVTRWYNARTFMEKNFDRWNAKKKAIHDSACTALFHEREVWWCVLGTNVGFEQDGGKGTSRVRWLF